MYLALNASFMWGYQDVKNMLLTIFAKVLHFSYISSFSQDFCIRQTCSEYLVQVASINRGSFRNSKLN